jgi:hypothetical protein
VPYLVSGLKYLAAGSAYSESGGRLEDAECLFEVGVLDSEAKASWKPDRHQRLRLSFAMYFNLLEACLRFCSSRCRGYVAEVQG